MKTLTIAILGMLMFCTDSTLAHWDNKMTTKKLYQGVMIELSLREGEVKYTDEEVALANEAERYVEGFLDAIDIRDEAIRIKIIDGIKTHLDKNPQQKKRKVRLVMLDVIKIRVADDEKVKKKK